MTEMNTIRAKMLKEGYRSVKVWSQDPNGGLPMILLWHIVQGDTPLPGDLRGGYSTKKEAWRVAEDHYARVNDDSAFQGNGSLDEVVGL